MNLVCAGGRTNLQFTYTSKIKIMTTCLMGGSNSEIYMFINIERTGSYPVLVLPPIHDFKS